MKGFGLAGIALALALATTQPAIADVWKVTGLSITPASGDVPDGSKVTVKCAFKMTLEEKDQNDLQVTISDNGAIKDFVNVSSGAWQGDSRTASYNIQGGGAHAIKCLLKSVNLSTQAGKITDEKTVSVTVKTNTVQPAEWGPKQTPRANIKDQKSGSAQQVPNPVLPPKR